VRPPPSPRRPFWTPGRRLGAGLAAALGLGAVGGLGAYTFVYAKGYSYLTDDPAACANCHVMQAYHDGWSRGSHRAVATCNDCHTPAGFVGKYAVKADNGFWHSFYFTTGNFPDRIRMRPSNEAVTDGACLHPGAAPAPGRACLPCHAQVGHMR
jgi:cytochrome c nitrite reductase small subunit